jgi:ABC-type multidrug transport system ATPase subunit
MVNDHHPLTEKLFGSCCAYVMQDDILFESFTVKEALTFAARLKLSFSRDMQDDRIAVLLKQLGLEKC